MSCGSVWACPRCSARIWAERGEELAQALDCWHADGHVVAMVTLTMRHHQGQRLAELWDALSDAWAAAATRNRQIRRLRVELRVAGWTRVVEATYGANGWHLHIHALIFIERPLKRAHAAAHRLGAAMFDGWSRRLVKAGFEAPEKDSGGLDVRVLNLSSAREAVASYQVKATYERAAYELTGNSAKDGRHGNRTPWGLLRAFAETGDCRELKRWYEWEAASKGRRALTWSRGLRVRLDLGEERADEDIAEDESQGAQLVALISNRDWARVCAIPDGPPRLLEVAEAACTPDAAWAAVALVLWNWGLDPPGLPDA